MAPFSSADFILCLHVAYIAIVVFSVPFIIVGKLKRWRWVCNPWFRLTHLLMIAIVVMESLLGIRCPLTVWERALRAPAGDTPDLNRDFVASYLDRLIFYQFPHWVFTLIYVVFGLVVLSLFFFAPIRFRRSPMP